MKKTNLKSKNILLYVFLTIITFGIFGIYWQYQIIKDVYYFANRTDNALKDAIFALLTVGLYGIYLWYKIGVYLDHIYQSQNNTAYKSTGLLTILAIFYQTFLCFCIAQSDVNYLISREKEEQTIEKTL